MFWGLLGGVDFVECTHYLEDVLTAGLEECFLFVVEFEFEDFLDAVFAKDNGDTEVAVVDAVLTFEFDTNGEYALLIFDNGLDHLGCRGAGCVPSRCAHEFNELAATILCAFYDGIECVFVNEVGYGDARYSGVAWEGNHCVSVTTEEETLNVLNGYTEVLGNEGFVASGVEDTCHAEDAVAGELGSDVRLIRHDVEGVGDDDDDGVGASSNDLLGYAFDDARVDADEVVTGHAWFAGETRSDDDNIGVGRAAVIVGDANCLGVVESDRGFLVDVESFALSYALFDVD